MNRLVASRRDVVETPHSLAADDAVSGGSRRNQIVAGVPGAISVR
jgi:hypothetical protein